MKWVCCFLSALLLCVSPCFAQTPAIDQAPAPCFFSDWTKLGDTSALTEYREVFPTALLSEKPENNLVPLAVFVPRSPGPHPAVLILHYWGAVDLKIERELAESLGTHGIASAIMTLPYHLERAPAGYRSGALAVTADPVHIRFTLTESVLDARRALDFLSSRPEFDHERLGIAGTSLGSIVSSVLFAVDRRASHAAFILGGADLAHIIWNSSRVVPEREVFRRDGYTEEKLRTQLKSIEPLEYLPRRKTGTAFVVGGKFDTVIPRRSTDELIQALPRAQTLWLDTGHYGGIFIQARLMREVGNYFERSFSGKVYNPPKAIYFPTVRLGAELSPGDGFDISAGIDFFRRRDAQSPVGTFLITPRGPRLFLGQGIDRSVSIGVLLTTKHVRPAILWSVVL